MAQRRNGSLNSDTGLTFSTWFLVERFSGSHPVRLLNITRQMREDQTPCLALELSEREVRLQVNQDRAQYPVGRGIACGEWHHIVVCLTRSVLKNNCSVGLFLDGVQLHGNHSKLSYVPQYSGAGSQNIFAIIGEQPSGSTFSSRAKCFLHSHIRTHFPFSIGALNETV